MVNGPFSNVLYEQSLLILVAAAITSCLLAKQILQQSLQFMRKLQRQFFMAF